MLTFGINKNTNLADYKKTCILINEEMLRLSEKINNKELNIEAAQEKAKTLIKQLNPRQYVNYHEVKRNDLIDLSPGGLHHSWEENIEKYPLGNVLYEICQDVMDPVSTIRSFDQGKFKTDGGVREIHIEDYFKYVDTDPTRNDINNARCKQKDNRLLTTKNYCLDIIEVNKKIIDYTNSSFCHLFVKMGNIEVSTNTGYVNVSKGHSCFIPADAKQYAIKNISNKAIILKTFIEF